MKVTADFEPKIKEGLISVEDIQDSVESVLVQAGYADVAKAYILYRQGSHQKLADGVYCTTYSNGTVVTVDYNRETFRIQRR